MEHMRGGVQGSRGHNVGRVLQAQPRGIPVCRHEFGALSASCCHHIHIHIHSTPPHATYESSNKLAAK